MTLAPLPHFGVDDVILLNELIRDAAKGSGSMAKGREAAWNDRSSSRDHRAIPLDRADVLAARAPMIAALLAQLGLDADTFVKHNAVDARVIHHQEYGIFHVERALGSPLIPAQDFVEGHGVRSVVGCGGGLRSGEVFALVLFSMSDVGAATADLFRTVAYGLKAALVPSTFKVLPPAAGA